MIDISSNCSRVDAVKATATQLKMQAALLAQAIPPNRAQRNVQVKLDTLDDEVKKGNAEQAEIALLEAQTALNEAQNTPSAPQQPAPQPHLDTYS
jgi:hypothetical protein